MKKLLFGMALIGLVACKSQENTQVSDPSSAAVPASECSLKSECSTSKDCATECSAAEKAECSAAKKAECSTKVCPVSGKPIEN